LDELTADLRERLGKAKRMQQASQARDKVLNELIDRTEVPLPASVVDSEIEVRMHDVVHAFDHDDARMAEWLSEQGKTREEFDASVREEAERSVKTQLVLDAVADAEEVGVSDMELTQQIVAQAQRYGVAPEEFLQRAQQSGQLGAVYADVRRGKALATVVRDVKVTDESGAEVDLSEFLGSDDADDTEVSEAVEGSADETPNGSADSAPAADAQPETANA
jgi:trigger factor